MKLVTLFLFVAVMHVSAASYSQTTKLKIVGQNLSIGEILDRIENQSNFSFFFNANQIDLSKRMDINADNQLITKILDEILANSGLTYTVNNKLIVIHKPGDTENVMTGQQTAKVTGKVIDPKGLPIPGVTVVVKGTTNGTITGDDGVYSISNVPAAGTIVFSFVGMNTVEFEVGNKSVINVTMTEESIGLDEVVAIGYGTQKKASITGAIAQYDAEKLNERPVQRIDQALVGQMAGVRVKQTSGMPGQGFSIQVRGTGSISANNEPLYVIDGFPLEVSAQNTNGGFSSGNPLDNINPNDIESIQILKDAAAAAIYGSRASNGVVMITTKKGKSGKPTINFNTYTGWNEASRKLDVLSSEEWIDRALEIMNYTYISKDPGTQNRQATDSYDTRVANIGSFNRDQIPDPRWTQPGHPGVDFVDWQDQIFRKGAVKNYQLSATGGNEVVKYFVSGDYLDQEGFFKNVDYKRYSVRANVEVRPNEKITAGINIAPSYSISNDPGVEGKDNILHVTAGMPPITDSSVGMDINVGNNTALTWGNSRNSPVRQLENTIGLSKISRTLATIFGQYEIIDNLKFKTTLNLDNTDQSKKYYRPAWVSGSSPSARLASGSFSGYNRQTFVNENTLSYDKVINEKHNVSAVAGVSYNSNTFNTFRISGTGGFGTDYITTLNDAIGINANSTDTQETKNTLLSYFGRVNYSLSDRYLVTASIRRDGSSKFGLNTKWGIFPAASIGWRVSEESFMKGIAWLNNLKVRASWGISGNNGIGSDYGSIALLSAADYSLGGAKVVGQASKNFPNRDLGWEQAETLNYGIDYGVLSNRVYGSFEYYTKRNTNLLLNIPVPTATGFSSALTNIGEVLNKGWEFELNTRNMTGKFEWTTNFNLSFNSNEVVKLGPDNAPILGGAFDIQHNILMVGQPMYSIYVVQQDGILTQADIDAGAALLGTKQVEGDPKYVDADHDGAITPDDRVLSGHPNPDYVWGVTNSFKFKGFDLSILVQGQNGGVLYSTFGRAMDRTGMGWLDQSIGLWRDRWRSPEDPGAGLKGKAYSSFGRIKNTDWLYSSDYWRVRNITLGYDLGLLFKSKIISGARAYVTAENWFGKDKYYGGFNPEAVNNSGDDYGGAPLPKSMVFGLNLTF
ncbi:MAG: TonB-dependent receptor [Prolixibacteraceae bacterium]